MLPACWVSLLPQQGGMNAVPVLLSHPVQIDSKSRSFAQTVMSHPAAKIACRWLPPPSHPAVIQCLFPGKYVPVGGSVILRILHKVCRWCRLIHRSSSRATFPSDTHARLLPASTTPSAMLLTTSLLVGSASVGHHISKNHQRRNEERGKTGA